MAAAALAVESAGRVRQKAYTQFYTANPGIFYALKALFLHLASNKGNPDLQYMPYECADVTANGGFEVVTSPGTLYAWYGKARRTTGTTAAFMQLFDAADNNTATATLGTQLINKTGQLFLQTWHNGFPFATALTIACDTAVAGATESTSTDACDGFVIIGA